MSDSDKVRGPARIGRNAGKRRAGIVAGLIAVFAAWCTNAEADPIYVIRGSRGVITFTNRTPSEGTNFEVFKPTRLAYSYFWRRRGGGGMWRARAIHSKYDGLIKETAKVHELDPALVRAVVHVESMFNPRARSYKGAMGLMQLMPGTAKRFGVANAFTPEENVAGGTKYLKFLMERYSGNETLALAAYNAGEGAVDGYGTIPPYQETQVYVRRVLKMKDLYSRLSE